jgi:hypothetical protein
MTTETKFNQTERIRALNDDLRQNLGQLRCDIGVPHLRAHFCCNVGHRLVCPVVVAESRGNSAVRNGEPLIGPQRYLAKPQQLLLTGSGDLL